MKERNMKRCRTDLQEQLEVAPHVVEKDLGRQGCGAAGFWGRGAERASQSHILPRWEGKVQSSQRSGPRTLLGAVSLEPLHEQSYQFYYI